MHGGITVRLCILCQLKLVGPPPQEHLPATDRHGLEAHGGAGDEGPAGRLGMTKLGLQAAFTMVSTGCLEARSAWADTVFR